MIRRVVLVVQSRAGGGHEGELIRPSEANYAILTFVAPARRAASAGTDAGEVEEVLLNYSWRPNEGAADFAASAAPGGNTHEVGNGVGNSTVAQVVETS